MYKPILSLKMNLVLPPFSTRISLLVFFVWISFWNNVHCQSSDSTSSFGDSTAHYRWQAFGGGFDENAVILSMIVKGDTLYVGGRFKHAGGDSSIQNLAMWYNNQWHSFGGGIQLGIVRCLYPNGNDLYVGGSFPGANGVISQGIIRWDGQNWHPVGGTGVNGDVRDIMMVGNNLYVTGTFVSIPFFTNPNFNHIARYDMTLDSWAPLQTGINTFGEKLCLFENDLWIAKAGNNIHRWSTNTNQFLNPEGYANSGTTQINQARAFAISGDRMYMGGSFFNLAGIDSADYIAYRENNSWHALGMRLPFWTTSIGCSALFPLGNDLFIGGNWWTNLTSDSTSPFTNRVLRYHIPTRSFHKLNNQKVDRLYSISCLAYYQNTLLMGGYFKGIGNDSTLQKLVFFRDTTTTRIFKPKRDKALSFYLYPNPGTGRVRISEVRSLQNTRLQMIDSKGLLQKEWIGLTSREIDVSDVPTGLYILKLTNDQGIGFQKFRKE